MDKVCRLSANVEDLVVSQERDNISTSGSRLCTKAFEQLQHLRLFTAAVEQIAQLDQRCGPSRPSVGCFLGDEPAIGERQQGCTEVTMQVPDGHDAARSDPAQEQQRHNQP